MEKITAGQATEAPDLAPDDMAQRVTQILKGALHFGLPDWITILEVTDHNGNAPNASNNYLMAEDGESFAGVYSSLNNYWDSYGWRRYGYKGLSCVQDETVARRGTFKFSQKSNGKWARFKSDSEPVYPK
jgi:hypothetical protein